VIPESAGSPEPPAERLAWSVDPDLRLLTILCRGGVSDHDLLSRIPRIWEACPEVIGYNTLVDARGLTSEGGWTWPALRGIARQWREFAQGRDAGRRTAIVTNDTWIAMLAGAFVIDYRGRGFRCFGDPAPARAWLASS